MADYIRPPFKFCDGRVQYNSFHYHWQRVDPQDKQCFITWGAISLKQNDPLNTMEKGRINAGTTRGRSPGQERQYLVEN